MSGPGASRSALALARLRATGDEDGACALIAGMDRGEVEAVLLAAAGQMALFAAGMSSPSAAVFFLQDSILLLAERETEP